MALLGVGASCAVGMRHYQNLGDELPSDIFAQYLQFISKYGRTYQNQGEFDHRYQIFKANYNKRMLLIKCSLKKVNSN